MLIDGGRRCHVRTQTHSAFNLDLPCFITSTGPNKLTGTPPGSSIERLGDDVLIGEEGHFTTARLLVVRLEWGVLHDGTSTQQPTSTTQQQPPSPEPS